MAIGIDTTLAREYAGIFAEEFQRRGIFGGTAAADNIANTKRREREEDASFRKLDKQRDKQIAQGEKLIKQADSLYKAGGHHMKVIQKASELRIRGEKMVAEANKQHSKETKKLAVNVLRKHQNAVTDTTTKLKNFGRELITWRSFLAAAGTALTKLGNDFRAQLLYGNTGSLMNSLNTAIQLGVDPELVSELQSRNRASVIAMGGVENWSNQLINVQRNLYTYVGDLDKTARFTAETLQTMRMAGIEPTTAALKIGSEQQRKSAGYVRTFGDTIRDIHVMTGQTFEEINGLMREYIESEEVRFRLTSTLDKERRRQIMQEVAERHKMLVGLGMTTEQAKAAAQALEKIAGEGPLARFKKAAKLQAMMGMMGMGAEGAEAAAIMRKGRRASPQEQARLTAILGQGQQKMAAAGVGGQGQEFAMYGAMEKLGLGDLLGPQSPMNTTLGDSFKEQQSQFAHQKTMGEDLKKTTSTVFEISRLLKALKDHPYFYGTMAILSGIGLILTKIYGLLMLNKAFGALGKGGLLKNLFKGLGSQITRFGGFLKSLPGKMFGGSIARMGGGIGGVAKVAAIAAPITATIQAAVQMWNESTEESASRAANLFGKAGESFLGDLGNRFVSAFRHIGQNLLSMIGINADAVGSWIGEKVYSGVQTVKSWWGRNMPTWLGGDSEEELKAKERMNKMSYNPRDKDIQEQRASRWARESGTRAKSGKVPQWMIDQQAELNKQFMNYAQTGGQLYEARNAENPQLNQLSEIMKAMNLTAEQAQKLTQDQIRLLAEMAADGKITKDEISKFRKEAGLPKNPMSSPAGTP